MKKILRSTLYIVMVLCMAFLPDAWLWQLGVSEWMLPLKILWWLPTELLLLAELGLQLGMYHKTSVRVLFTMILFSVFPKVLFIVLDFMMPWWVAMIPTVIVMLCLLYGFTHGWKRLEVKQVSYSSPDLPPYFDGYKILHFSDFHLGTFPKGTDFVEKVVEKANLEDVEMMVFTGDLVNNSAEEVRPYFDTLKKLHAPDGIYSVWGNHDYCEYDNNHSIGALKRNRKMLYDFQSQLGWKQLMNEHVTISHGLASIELIGVENAGNPPFSNRANLKKAMKGIDEITGYLSDQTNESSESHAKQSESFKILLTHDPHHWRKEALAEHIQLSLSGHTHAGQIQIGRLTPARMAFKEWGGIYRQGKQMLYVSAGLGGSFPFRLGAWPEMTVITLKRENLSSAE